MEADKVGMAVGACVAAVVLVVCFFYTKVQGFEVVFRASVAFAVTYAITFQAFRYIQKTTDDAMSAFEEARLAEEAARRWAAESEAEEAGEETSGERK